MRSILYIASCVTASLLARTVTSHDAPWCMLTIPPLAARGNMIVLAPVAASEDCIQQHGAQRVASKRGTAVSRTLCQVVNLGSL